MTTGPAPSAAPTGAATGHGASSPGPHGRRSAASPRLRRQTDGRLLGGVAGGLAEHLALDVLHVRLALAVLCGIGGFGIALYAALWVFVPVQCPDDDPAGLAAATRGGRRPQRGFRRGDVGQLVALGTLALGLVLLLNSTGSGVPLRVLVPVLIAAAGLTLLWTQADAAERARLVPRSVGAVGLRVRVLTAVRVLGGLALVVVALLTFLVGSGQTAIRESAVLLVVVALGLGLVIGPVLWRLVRQRDTERHERLLSQQQADVAAHLHDSVLQTLALIQRRADDPRAVVALARAQERDLRGWLFEAAPAERSTVRAAVEAAAAEVETSHGVPVEVVVVGDCPMDERLAALVRAAREAIVNAAKHSGAPVVDVYVECADGEVELFVRDRGRGFDLATVPRDRMGLSRSVVSRTVRHGGTADVRSAPGEGTEVRLRMSVGGRTDDESEHPAADDTTAHADRDTTAHANRDTTAHAGDHGRGDDA